MPSYLKTVPAVGPGGRYMLRRADGGSVRLEEVTRAEKDANGNRLMELFLDGRRRRRAAACCAKWPTTSTGRSYDAAVQQDLAAPRRSAS